MGLSWRNRNTLRCVARSAHTVQIVTSNEWPPPDWVEPSRRSRRPFVMGVVVASVTALVVVIVASLVIGSGERDTKSVGRDVSRALAVFDEMVDYGVDGYAELFDCPVGDARTLADSVAGVVALDSTVVNGQVFVDAYEKSGDYPAIVQCFVTSDPDDGDGPTSIGFSVSGVPGGSYLDFLIVEAYEPDIAVDVAVRRRSDAGPIRGDLFGYCYRAVDLSGCGADLVDRVNGVVLSVYLQGSDRTAVETVTALERVLDDMIDSLVEIVRSEDYSNTTPWARGRSFE